MPRERIVRWTVPAKNDLVAAYSYLRDRDRRAAATFARKIREAVALLPEFPRRGKQLHALPLVGEYRSVVIDYYRVIYRVDSEVLFVMRVWDCRQDPALMWEELDGE